MHAHLLFYNISGIFRDVNNYHYHPSTENLHYVTMDLSN